MYGSKTMLWKKKERSRIRAVKMDNIRGFLGIRRMNRVPNAQTRELCGVKKELDDRIDEGVFWCVGHVERRESDRIAKRVYIGECAGNRSMDGSRKRWIDTVKECLRKKRLDVRQARNGCEWRGFVKWNAWGLALGMNP